MTKKEGISPQMRTRGLLVLLLVLAGAYAYLQYRGRPTKVVYSANAFYQVKRGDMLISVTEEGSLRALNETVVRNELDGVSRILYLIPEGTQVAKGELMVELDSSALRDRLAEQEVQYQDALFVALQARENIKIQQSMAESQIKDAELALDIAKADLEKFRDGEAPLAVKTMQVRAKVIAEQVRIARERQERTEILYKQGNASRSEAEADQLTLNREQLALKQYEEDLRLVQKYDHPNQIRQMEARVEQAEKDMERLKQRSANELAQAEADLKTSERALDFMEDSLDLQKSRLERAKIYAPQDGLVVYAAVSPFQNYSSAGMQSGNFRTGGRGFGGGGGGGFGGNRGGRGGRGGSRTATTLSGGSSSGSQSASSGAQSSSANSTTEGGGATATAAAGGSASGGGNVSSGRGGGGAGSSGTSSAASAFTTYPSMRAASIMPARTASGGAGGGGNAAGGSAAAGASSSGSSSEISGGQNNFGNQGANQFGSRMTSMEADSSTVSGVLEEGILVRQRQELIRLPDVSKMVADIRIPEARVRQLKQGMLAYVQIENLPGPKYKGSVRRIAPLPDSTASWLNPNVKVYPVDVLVDDELPLLKPGVSARAQIIITNLPRVLSVPIHTVVRSQGSMVCFVKRGENVTPVAVTTGHFNDSFIQITSGLNEGDLVLLAPVGDATISEEPGADTNNVESAPVPEAPRSDQPRSISHPPDGERRSGSERGNRGLDNPANGEPQTPRMERSRGNPAEGSEGGERRRSREGGGRRQRPAQTEEQ